MELGLKGKTVMVAAGSQGIGLAVAAAFAREGARVSLCGRSKDHLEAARVRLDEASSPENRGRHLAVRADVSKATDLEAWFYETHMRLGDPWVVVTNTGGPSPGLSSEITDEQWEQGFQSTLMNVVRMSRLALPGFQRLGSGRLIHLTSLVARDPHSLLAISTTLRTGIRGLVRLQAKEWGALGVTVNGVLPGHTLTGRQIELAHVKSAREGVEPQEILARQAKEIPLKRYADPKEIANVVVFLGSEAASYISGESVLVDGAATHGL